MKEISGKSVALLGKKNDIDTLEDLNQIPELLNALKNQFGERKV